MARSLRIALILLVLFGLLAVFWGGIREPEFTSAQREAPDGVSEGVSSFVDSRSFDRESLLAHEAVDSNRARNEGALHEPNRIVVQVATADGHPVLDASVSGWINGERLRAAPLSSAPGSYHFDETMAGAYRIRVQANGFAIHDEHFPRPFVGTLRVVLGAGTTLVGRVQFCDGPGSRARVVAFQLGVDRTLFDDALVASLGESDALAGDCDAEGFFEISGAVPGARYWLIAGGEGHASAPERVEVTAPTDSIVIRARSLVGANVMRVDASSETVEIDDSYLWSDFSIVTPDDGRLASIQRTHPAIALAGIDWTLAESDRTCTLFLWGSPDARRRWGPIAMRERIAGFRESALEFFAERPSDGQFPVVRHDLFADAEGFAPLRVALDGLESEPTGLSARTEYQLTLRPISPGSSASIFRWGSEVNKVLRAVPIGKYQAELRILATGLTLPSDDQESVIVTLNDEGGDVAFDCSTRSTVEFNPATEDGQQHTGRFIALLAPADGHVDFDRMTIETPGSPLRFAQRPYRVTGLNLGEWRVVPGIPPAPGGFDPEGEVFTIVAGESKTVGLVVQDGR